MTVSVWQYGYYSPRLYCGRWRLMQGGVLSLHKTWQRRYSSSICKLMNHQYGNSEFESQFLWWDLIDTWSVSYRGSFACIWATTNQVIVCIANHLIELWPQDTSSKLTIVCSMICAWSCVSTWGRTSVAIPLKRWRATPCVCPITVILIEITIK